MEWYAHLDFVDDGEWDVRVTTPDNKKLLKQFRFTSPKFGMALRRQVEEHIRKNWDEL